MSIPQERAASTLAPSPYAAARVALWQERIARQQALGLDEGHEGQHHRLTQTLFLKGLEWGIRFSGLYARGLRNALRPRLRHLELTWPDLPDDLEGFRILQLADFHFRRKDLGFADVAARLVEGIETDLCVLTGDYRFGHYGHFDHIYAPIAKVLSGVRSTHGAVGILGNHDHSGMLDGLERLGVRMLINEGFALRVGRTALWLAGVDDSHKYHCDHLGAALAGAPAGAFPVLLAHAPELIAPASEAGVRLYVCGHTHGGQLCLPGIGAVKVNARCSRRYVWGPWQSGGMHGYTTSGLGASDIPVRYNCPPEAVQFTLRRGPELKSAFRGDLHTV